MIINNYRPGQLCNRLWHFSSFAANAMEHGYKLIYPALEDYEEYFEGITAPNLNKYNISLRYSKIGFIDSWTESLIVRYVERIVQACNRRSIRIPFCKVYYIEFDYDAHDLAFDMGKSDFIKEASANLVFVRGWSFRDNRSLIKHSAVIRDLFRPHLTYQKQVNGIINTCRNLGDILIGVHIRRGDYRDFLNGQYYFEDDVYLEKMQQLDEDVKRQGKRCVFLICSNESVLRDHFKDLTVSYNKRHFITDLYLLAACDYIIGPPSTFSMWASFYGKVPLCQIHDKEQKMALNRFSVVLGEVEESVKE